MNTQLLKQSAKIWTSKEYVDDFFPEMIEYAGRVCTGTEHKLVKGSPNYKFLETLLKNQHMSVFEHCSINLELVTDRAISHQLVRHRIAAISQQSMRYIKFTTPNGQSHFGMIEPAKWNTWDEDTKKFWLDSTQRAADDYETAISLGMSAEDARRLLPTATATKLIITWNLRQLLHVLYNDYCGRFTNKHAEEQVRNLMGLLVNEAKSKYNFLNWLLTTTESIKHGAND